MTFRQIAPVILALFAAPIARAELKPDKVFTADAKKTKFYLRDGMITGGDRAVEDVIVKDIRRGTNPAGFERIVIDLEGDRRGGGASIRRPPYYQVSVTPDEKRLVFSLWGNPKLDFDSKRVIAEFHKSKVIDAVELFPRLEEHVWTFAMEMKKQRPVEVFELSNPARIILDVKTK